MATFQKYYMLFVLFIFTSNSAHNVYAKVAIYTGEALQVGGQLINGAFSLSMQGDCNLVLRDNSNAIWSTGTAGRGNNCYVRMQADGNLVIYNGQGPVWASNTVKGSDTYELILQEDRNLVIYKGSARKAIWDTKTYHHAQAFISSETQEFTSV